MSEPTCIINFKAWPKPVLFLAVCYAFITKRWPPVWMVGRVKVDR